jgi:hypothetical protein
MKKIIIIALLLAPAGNLFCSPVTSLEGITHRFLKAGWNTGEIAIIDSKGNVEWSLPVTDECSDCWYLPDGGMAYSFSNRKENKAGMVRLDRRGKELWTYTTPEGRDNHSCAALPGGGFLMGQSAIDGAWMVEVDKNGKVTKEVAVKIDWEKYDKPPDPHHTFRHVRKTPGGNYLAAVFKLGIVLEWDAKGKLVRQFDKGVYVAIRLANGNTLASAPNHKGEHGPIVVEYNGDGEIVWQLKADEMPFAVSMVCGLQRLPNGNTIISNVPHGQNAEEVKKGNGPQLFEVTRDKKVVWQFKNWDLKYMGSFQIIDTNGVKLNKSEIHR